MRTTRVWTCWWSIFPLHSTLSRKSPAALSHVTSPNGLCAAETTSTMLLFSSSTRNTESVCTSNLKKTNVWLLVSHELPVLGQRNTFTPPSFTTCFYSYRDSYSYILSDLPWNSVHCSCSSSDENWNRSEPAAVFLNPSARYNNKFFLHLEQTKTLLNSRAVQFEHISTSAAVVKKEK